MTIATSRNMTLEAYLNADFDEDTDTQYVLENGELVAVPTKSDLNGLITIFLIAQFLQLLPPTRLRVKTEMVVSGYRATTRIPDLMVLTEDLVLALKGAHRSLVMPEMPPPALVIEVTSPGKKNQDRDYRYKRFEYAARGIQEYWIIDPMVGSVSVLTLVEGLYEEQRFGRGDAIASSLFPALTLTVDQILNPE